MILSFLTSNEQSYEKNEDLEHIYFGKISNLFHSAEGRSLFCDSLESIKHNSFISSVKIVQLAAIITSLLTVIMMEDDHDSLVFCKLVVLSHIFYSEDTEGKRAYLSDFISSHNIWNDRNRWIEAIEYATVSKIAADKESVHKYQSLKRKGHNLITTLKNLAVKVPVQKGFDNEQNLKSAAFAIISQFNFHMIHLGIPFEAANAMILECCQKVDLDTDRTCVLLAELQANQRKNLRVEDE